MGASASFRPATAWRFPHPYGTQEPAVCAEDAPPAAAPPARAVPHRLPHRREVLLALLQESLMRGHWRVALRRYLMLRGCGFEIPEGERRRCEAYLARCKAAELRRMQADARAWLRFVGAA